jgi:hypothetical protein
MTTQYVWTSKAVAKLFGISPARVSNLTQELKLIPRVNREGRGIQYLYSDSDLIKISERRGIELYDPYKSPIAKRLAQRY